ncbi:MAG: hypothetical protein U1G08_12795 [Verrucomicrobiota bacterium]
MRSLSRRPNCGHTALRCVRGLLAVLGSGLAAGTVSLPVPNASFERPATPFVDIRIESWIKTPKPADYDESSGQLWDQLNGVFKNTNPGKADHIDNIDGTQAAYLFAVPDTGLYLEGTEVGGAFPVRFSVGDAFTLTVGVIGGGGNMAEGAGLRVELYALGEAGVRIPVRSTTVLFSRDQFPSTTHFVDVSVSTPEVTAADAWAGRLVGIGIYSTVTQGSELAGGYWDLDNVRLTASRPDSFSLNYAMMEGKLQVVWPGSEGARYQVQTSLDLGSWKDLGSPLNGTGQNLGVELPISDAPAIFVRVVTAPGL